MAIRRSRELGYRGEIWPVNPERRSMEGLPCYASVEELPGVPDAAHVAVNRQLTVDIVRRLARAGAGGAVCYAAGFAEMGAEGAALERDLVAAAGDMPLIGPNTFGLLNFVDRCALWPYLFGCEPVERGVALISQSGNIAMNLTMNRRSVNFTHVVGTGNQAVLGPGQLIEALLDDGRVTAIGMYIEGIDDLDRFGRAAARALEQRVPIVVLKVGKTAASARQSSTHTSSLTGSDRLHDALFRRLGIIRVESLNRLLETLKVLDLAGPLRGANVLSLSCSGGEAAIMADLAAAQGLVMRPFSEAQLADLNAQFANYVTVSNPFDYNTSIWGDGTAQRRCFTTALAGEHDAAFLIYDHPSVEDAAVTGEVAEWRVALDAFIDAHRQTGMPAFVLSTISELLPDEIRRHLLANGVVPLQGFEDGLAAYAAAAGYHAFSAARSGAVVLPRLAAGPGSEPGAGHYLDEWDSKARLAEFGVPVPAGERVAADDAAAAAERLGYPVAVKALGPQLLHKSELGAVRLNLGSAREVREAVADIRSALGDMPGGAPAFLVERMVSGPVVELIVGVERDPQFGPALVIGAGGVMVELLADSVSLLLPVDRDMIGEALGSLRVAGLLQGFRHAPPADTEALIDAIEGIARFTLAHWDELLALDVNPLLVGAQGAGVAAVDAVVCLARPALDNSHENLH